MGFGAGLAVVTGWRRAPAWGVQMTRPESQASGDTAADLDGIDDRTLVQAFLAFNTSFRVMLSLPLLRHHDEAFLRRAIPGYQPVEAADYDSHFGSLWIERTS